MAQATAGRGVRAAAPAGVKSEELMGRAARALSVWRRFIAMTPSGEGTSAPYRTVNGAIKMRNG